MKVAINTCFGGFGFSEEATQWLYEQGLPDIASPAEEYFGGPGSKFYEVHKDDERWKSQLQEGLERWRNRKNADSFYTTQFTPDEKFCLYAGRINEQRHHPKVIECIEKFGEKANGSHAKLRIVEIPDGTEYTIEEYDGMEHVAEVHQTWH